MLPFCQWTESCSMAPSPFCPLSTFIFGRTAWLGNGDERESPPKRCPGADRISCQTLKGSGEAERTVFLNSFQDREAEYCPPDFYIIKI